MQLQFSKDHFKMASNLSISHWEPNLGCLILKQRCLFEARVIDTRFLMAITGQIGLEPRAGIFNILTVSTLQCF